MLTQSVFLLIVTIFAQNAIAQNETAISLDELIGIVQTTTESLLDFIKPIEERDTRCSDETSKCVPYYQCVSSIKSPNVVLNIAYNETSPCVDYFESCCLLWDISENNTAPVITGNGTQTCGKRNPNGVGFSTAGNVGGNAEFGEFPWMLAILRETNLNGSAIKKFECGGSLIHPSVVLTAAHCARKQYLSNILIRAGEWDTQTQLEFYKHEERRVREIVHHPEYNKDNLRYDMALLFLASEFDTNPVTAPHISTICLPPANTRFDGANCVASGWGKDQFGLDGKYQVLLRKVDLPIVSSDQCQQTLRKTRLGKFFNLHESFLCAGGVAGKDTCKGDGGSPLACPIPGSKDSYYQTGIVSWGLGCNSDRVPGVYTNVAFLRNWIDQELQSKGIIIE